MLFQLTIIVAGAFLGGVVNGAAGFAFAIIVTTFWVHVLPPIQIVTLAAACASTLHIASVWHFRKQIIFDRLWPFLVGALFGAPLGVLMLRYMPAEQFRTVIGVLFIAYAIFFIVRPKLTSVKFSKTGGKLADAAVGWASGIIGGAVLLHGILPTIWCGHRGWDKVESRSVYQPYILFTNFYVMFLAAANTSGTIFDVAIFYFACLPALAAGFLIGIRLFHWISE
jgi:uncharacterized membrane protein YfcA